MARATINISEMTNVVTGLETAIEDLSYSRTNLRSAALTYNLDPEVPEGANLAISWAEAELPALRRRLALAVSIEAQSVSELPGIAVLEDDTDIPMTDPDEAEANGRETALALLEADGAPDSALIEEVEANAHDPYFAAGLAQALSPAEVASILGEFDQHLEENEPDGIDWTTPAGEWEERSGEVAEFNELVGGYETLVRALGASMGTATTNVGRLALPDSYAQQWAGVITDDEWDDNDGAALALLLENGTYSTSFLDTVSVAIYDEEIDSDPSSSVWGPRGSIRGLDGDQVLDPMASVMSALGHNPEAAQNFFNGGGTISEAVHEDDVTYTYDPPVNSRLQYLLQERTWATSSDHSNGGYLGEALEAATTHFRNGEGSGRISAEVASQTFHLIGQHTGYNPDGNDRVWQMWDGMRDNVANIVADYAPDLLHTASSEPDYNEIGAVGWSDTDTANFGAEAPYGATMTQASIQGLLGTLGQNDDHIDVVLAGLAAASRWRLSTGFDEALRTDADMLALLQGQNEVAGSTAADLGGSGGWVIAAMFNGAQDEHDRRMSEFEALERFTDAVTGIPGLIPGGSGISYVADVGSGEALRLIQDRSLEGAAGNYEDLADGHLTPTERMIWNELLARGAFDDEILDQAADEDLRVNPPPDAEGLIDEGPPPQFNFDSEAWNNWNGRPYEEFVTQRAGTEFLLEMARSIGLEVD